MAQVDVIIPAFNPGLYLRETLDSVVAQTLQDWNVLVVDDGSTEDLSWVDSYDLRVRRIRQDNAGLSAARNRGIGGADSPFVAFVDADDIWLPDKLRDQVAALQESGAALCSTAFEIIDAAGHHLGPGYEGYATSYVELLQGNGVCLSTVMVPRADLDRVGLFASDLRQAQDWDLWLRLTQEGAAIKLARVLARYRQHSASMSLNYATMLQESTHILSTHERALLNQRRDDLAKAAGRGRRRVKKLAGIQAFDAFRSNLRSDRRAAAVHLGRALRWAPGFTMRSVSSSGRFGG